MCSSSRMNLSSCWGSQSLAILMLSQSTSKESEGKHVELWASDMAPPRFTYPRLDWENDEACHHGGNPGDKPRADDLAEALPIYCFSTDSTDSTASLVFSCVLHRSAEILSIRIKYHQVRKPLLIWPVYSNPVVSRAQWNPLWLAWHDLTTEK